MYKLAVLLGSLSLNMISFENSAHARTFRAIPDETTLPSLALNQATLVLTEDIQTLTESASHKDGRSGGVTKEDFRDHSSYAISCTVTAFQQSSCDNLSMCPSGVMYSVKGALKADMGTWTLIGIKAPSLKRGDAARECTFGDECVVLSFINGMGQYANFECRHNRIAQPIEGNSPEALQSLTTGDIQNAFDSKLVFINIGK